LALLEDLLLHSNDRIGKEFVYDSKAEDAVVLAQIQEPLFDIGYTLAGAACLPATELLLLLLALRLTCRGCVGIL
jgi:hypothetical protein